MTARAVQVDLVDACTSKALRMVVEGVAVVGVPLLADTQVD